MPFNNIMSLFNPKSRYALSFLLFFSFSFHYHFPLRDKIHLKMYYWFYFCMTSQREVQTLLSTFSPALRVPNQEQSTPLFMLPSTMNSSCHLMLSYYIFTFISDKIYLNSATHRPVSVRDETQNLSQTYITFL